MALALAPTPGQCRDRRTCFRSLAPLCVCGSTPRGPSLTQTEEAAFIAESLRAEAGAITRLADRVLNGSEYPDWQAALDLLERCTGHVVVAGMGKSGLVGAKVSATFSSLGQPSHVLHPAEAIHGDLGSVRRHDVVILLSYSGATEEVINLAAILRSDGVPRISFSAHHTTELGHGGRGVQR